jgi:hypothetical protein
MPVNGFEESSVLGISSEPPFIDCNYATKELMIRVKVGRDRSIPPEIL